MSTDPSTWSKLKHGGGNNILWVLFCKGYTYHCTVLGDDEWGHASQDFGQQPLSSKSTEGGS